MLSLMVGLASTAGIDASVVEAVYGTNRGISELQTGIASSSLFYPVDLSNTLATHASRLQNRLSRSLVCSKGQVFTNALPCGFQTFSPKGCPNLFWRWRDVSCFWKNWVHIVLCAICVSQRLFQQGKQTVNCKLLLSNRRFPVRSVFCRCGGALKFIFSIQIIGLGSLVSNGVASCGFSAGHTCEEDDTCKSNVARPGMDSGLFWCSKHIIQQCSSVPKSVDHVLLVSVFRQNLIVWPRWKCWFVSKSWFFLHLQVSLQCWCWCAGCSGPRSITVVRSST